MRRFQVLVVGLALVAGYAAGVALNRPTAGQSPALEALPAPQPTAVSRFHTSIVNSGAAYPLLVLTDTTTGHCWVRESGPQEDEDWRDLGTPGSAKK
jgi:hypothetical protein